MMNETMKIAAHLLDDILDGHKSITIRQGRRDLGPGSLVFESSDDNGRTAEVLVHSVEYTLFGLIALKDFQNDGFEDAPDALVALRHFYPRLDLASEVTIVRFRVL